MEKADMKSVSYTAISQMEAVKNNWISYQAAKEIVLRWLSGRTGKDVIDYFKKRGYQDNKDDNTPSWVVDDLSKDAWEAFEYFEII